MRRRPDWRVIAARRNVAVHGHPTCLDCPSTYIRVNGRCDSCYRRRQRRTA